MTTVANPRQEQGSHWYFQNGEPCHTVIAKSTGLPRPTTIADARKLGLLPSVTNILKCLHKPGLQDWLIEQAVLACLTTPRKDGESLDAFVHRVLRQERVQDQEAQVARDRGTEIHQALEDLFNDRPISDEIKPWVMPCFEAIRSFGPPLATEKVVTSLWGYAGKVDLIQGYHGDELAIEWDFKTTKTLPKTAYPEHRLQLAAYAEASPYAVNETANAYISTVECGKFVLCHHHCTWRDTYERGFKPLLTHWKWTNDYP